MTRSRPAERRHGVHQHPTFRLLRHHRLARCGNAGWRVVESCAGRQHQAATSNSSGDPRRPRRSRHPPRCQRPVSPTRWQPRWRLPRWPLRWSRLSARSGRRTAVRRPARASIGPCFITWSATPKATALGLSPRTAGVGATDRRVVTEVPVLRQPADGASSGARGVAVGRHRVRRLMRRLGLEAIYPGAVGEALGLTPAESQVAVTLAEGGRCHDAR